MLLKELMRNANFKYSIRTFIITLYEGNDQPYVSCNVSIIEISQENLVSTRDTMIKIFLNESILRYTGLYNYQFSVHNI